MPIPSYTVQKISKGDKLFGPTHWSDEVEETSCGLMVDHNWYILTSDGSGVPSCPRCLEAIKNAEEKG